MRVLVCTVVHNPTDARIFRREIGALLDAGHEVTAIAPWQSNTPGDDRVRRVSVPRAVGRNRLASLMAARSKVRELAVEHDLLVVHDPELLVVLPWAELKRTKTPVVWDVHEDLAAALLDKAWLPPLLRRPLAVAVRLMEKWAERRCTLLLAEKRYQERFAQTHPLVLNLPLVPSQLPTADRKRQVIYVGSITQARGLNLMLQLAALLQPHDIKVRLIGETHSAEDTALINSAANVEWHGALPNAVAMAEVESSLVGLSLLANLPNYQHSMPTKVLEYMASGTAVVSTPLPLAVEVLGEDGVLLAGFDDSSLEQAAAAIVRLADDGHAREQLTRRAFERVSREYNWLVDGPKFVRVLEAVAARQPL